MEVYSPVRMTRNVQGMTIRLPIPRNEHFKKSVYYMGSSEWNALTSDVRNTVVLNDFKKEINLVI